VLDLSEGYQGASFFFEQLRDLPALTFDPHADDYWKANYGGLTALMSLNSFKIPIPRISALLALPNQRQAMAFPVKR
jgi:hypothetical protein